MIICVSANPAIDRRLRLKNLKIGAVNRVFSADYFAGGKAAHVAMAARSLGAREIIWVGFLGGSTGEHVERQLTDLNIKVNAVRTSSATRVNYEIIDANGSVTEILEPGGAISENELAEMNAFCRKIFANTKRNFQVIFSGSLPPNVPADFYKHLISAAREYGGRTILDTSGEAFIEGLKANPDLIKPNAQEAENVLNMKIRDVETARKAVEKLIYLGAKNVVISLGSDGLIWTGEEGLMLTAKPPTVKVHSTVGCGDSTVAGLAVAAERKLSMPETLSLAAACGAANCLADFPAQIKIRDVERLLPQIEIKKIC